MYVDLTTIITICGVITGIAAVAALIWKFFRWVNHQKEQDQRQTAFENNVKAQQRSCANEQMLIIRGLLACLKGLNEKGCNGAVPDMIKEIEEHINQKAHE